MVDRERPRVPRSLFTQRAQVSTALRVGSHAALGLLEQRHGREKARWAALGVAAIAVDVTYGRWLAAEEDPRPGPRAVFEAAEGAVWALAGRPDAITSRLPQIASVVPTAIEWGVRTGSGDRALPQLEPSRAFPPPRGERLRSILQAVGPVAAPHLAIRAARRLKGWEWNRFEYVWPAMGLGGGIALGYYRQKLHRETRTDWLRRAHEQIVTEETRARAQAAIRQSQGHHFKKNLVALGTFGSDRARALAHEQQAHPSVVVEGSPGASLFSAANGIPIQPHDSRDLWLGEEQRDHLDLFIDATDEELEASDPEATTHPAVLQVESRSGPEIRVRYRGRALVLRNPPPRLKAGLDPIPLTLAVSAAWKVLTWLNPDAQSPALPSLLVASLDITAAAHQWRHRHRPEIKPDPLVIAASVVSATAFNGILLADPPPTTSASGEQIFFGTSPSAGVMVVLGTYADQLGAWVWPIMGITVGGWLLGAVGRSPRPARAVVIESMTLWQAFLATKGLATSLAAEANALEADLQSEFGSRVRAARHAAVRHELDRFRRQVDVAEEELAALGSTLDPTLAELIKDECTTMRRWLEDPWTEHELAY